MRTPSGPRRRRGLSRREWFWALLGIGATLFGGRTLHAQSVTTEYQVKSLFVLNFMRFVEWPADTFPDASAPFVVGTVGDNPFGPLLRDAMRNQQVRGRQLLVKELGPHDNLAQCHLLFISRSERERLDGILSSLRSSPTLTISELEQFCQDGGMIRFVTLDGNVRFEINPSAAARARLQVSAKLLTLARAIVDPPPARAP